MDDLIQDKQVLVTCAKLIRAVELTDMRVGISTDILKGFVMPDCWSFVTDLYDNIQHMDTDIMDPQLGKLSARSYVVLTATSIVLACMGCNYPALAITHELRLHDEQKYQWLDWEDLDDEFKNSSLRMDQATLRFVVATVGTKVARRLYRERDMRQAFPNSKPVSTKILLDTMEAFAHDQCTFRPTSGVGWWNLGYIAQQSVAKRGVDPLVGTAECLAMMREAYKRADEQDDDFLKSGARIEAAMCLTLGGEGIVAYKLSGKSVQTKRDFLMKQPEKEESGVYPFHIMAYGDTDEIIQECIKHEQGRLRDHVPPTQLDPGEDLLIPRWEVLQLWNEAMKGGYDSLKQWGHHIMVYGETAGWDMVVAFLEQTSHYAPTQFGNAPNPPGFPKERDKGFGHTQKWTCAKCGKYNDKCRLCSRCKEVSYCTRECQVAHWKTHRP